MLALNSLNDSKLIETYKILDKFGKVLTLNFILEKLIEKEILRDNPSDKAKFWTSVTVHGEIYTTLLSFGHAAIGLKDWVPHKGKPTKRHFIIPKRVVEIEQVNLSVKSEVEKGVNYVYSHKLTKDEIKESFLAISSELLSFYEFVGEGFSLTTYCYGGFNFIVWVNSEFKSIHSFELLKFYKENNLKTGDIIYLEKREDDPAGLYLYTKWQRYEVSEDRDESGKIGKDKGHNGKTKIKDEKEEINGEYLLALIQKNDLVYKYVLNNGPSDYYQIADAIARDLSVPRDILDKLTFIDFSDERIARSEGGEIFIKQAMAEKLSDYNPIRITETLKDKKKHFYAIIAVIVILIMLITLAYLLL